MQTLSYLRSLFVCFHNRFKNVGIWLWSWSIMELIYSDIVEPRFFAIRKRHIQGQRHGRGIRRYMNR